MSEEAEPTGTPAAEVLRRWERGGAVWRLLSRTQGSVEISLMTCTGDQEVDRLVSDDPELLDFLGDRTRSDE
ncbi:MAG TPA: hypothetical protein VIQ26_00130 [Microbacteriaceae bacterium]